MAHFDLLPIRTLLKNVHLEQFQGPTLEGSQLRSLAILRSFAVHTCSSSSASANLLFGRVSGLVLGFVAFPSESGAFNACLGVTTTEEP